MICLQENVCFLHSILLQGLCVSPPVNMCVREWWSMPCRLCFTGRVEEVQAFINQTIYSLPSLLSSPLPQPNPKSFSLLTFFYFSLFFFSLESCPIQIQTEAVYWVCDTPQINTYALFTKMDFLVYNVAPETSSSGQQWRGWWEVWLGSSTVDTTQKGVSQLSKSIA